MPYSSPEKLRAYNKQWRAAHPEKARAYSSTFYMQHPETRSKHQKAWRIRNRPLERAYRIEKYRTDVNTRLRRTIRCRFRQAVKTGSGIQDLGCSVENLKRYIERQWEPGMTWENWSQQGWHIDHKRPLASFDLTDPEQRKKACRYTNLQPLWALDNLRKGKKWG